MLTASISAVFFYQVIFAFTILVLLIQSITPSFLIVCSYMQ